MKKHEGNAEIGTGAWGWSQCADLQPMVQALPQRARQDGLEAPNEAAIAENRRLFNWQILHLSDRKWQKLTETDSAIATCCIFVSDLRKSRGDSG